MQPEILNLIRSKDFGQYANKDGELQLCFLSNNDITGGNSGSPVFDKNARLIGLAFDGNWEAMSGDIAFEPDLQRTISVDIRYVLYMIDKWGEMPAVDRGIEIGEIIVGADSFWLDQKATKGSLPEYIILKSAGKDGVKPPFRHSVYMTSVLFLFYQSCRHPHHNSAIRTAAAISYKCFAKPTIILSYPFVYWFKPICYGMRVAILNYHSSVITIMVKTITSCVSIVR